MTNCAITILANLHIPRRQHQPNSHHQQRGVGRQNLLGNCDRIFLTGHLQPLIITWFLNKQFLPVLATLAEKTSAEHGFTDGFLGVSVLASLVIDDWDLDLLETVGEGSSAGGGSPPGNNDLSGSLLFFGGKVNGLYVFVKIEGRGNEEDSNVVGKVPAIVVGVSDDAGNLTGLFESTVVVPVKVSSNDGELASASRVDTVSGGDNHLLVVDNSEGSTANVAAAVTEGDLVWELSLVSIFSSDNSVGVDFPLNSGEGCRSQGKISFFQSPIVFGNSEIRFDLLTTGGGQKPADSNGNKSLHD